MMSTARDLLDGSPRPITDGKVSACLEGTTVAAEYHGCCSLLYIIDKNIYYYASLTLQIDLIPLIYMCEQFLFQ